MAFSNKKRGEFFDDLDSVWTDPKLDPPTGSCFNCWEFGHRLKDCPKGRARDITFCENCGRRGVLMLECPRCSRHCVDCIDKLMQLTEVWRTKKQPSPPKEDMKKEPESKVKEEEVRLSSKDICCDLTDCIEALMRLVEMTSHLSIETQEKIILLLVEERKEMIRITREKEVK